MAVIALDLGGTKLSAAIFNSRGKILHKNVSPLEEREGREVGKLICKKIKDFLQVAAREKIKVKAIGVCVPGIADQKTGKVWAPNIPGWENYPLHKEISEVVARKKIKVVIDNDRAACILGEVWQGNAKDCKNAIFIAVGTGIGAGILVDGKVLRGGDDIAGAIGWLALDRPFRSEYISCGCFEHHASGEGIVKIAKEFLAADKNYSGDLKNVSPLTANDIFEKHGSRDPIAVKTLRTAIEFWGMAAANLVSIFNPDKIIFGGGVFGPAVEFLPDIFAEAKKWAQPVSIQKVKLATSTLDGDAGLYGAGYMALKQS